MQLQNYVCIFHLQKANLKNTYWQFHSQAQKKKKVKTKQSKTKNKNNSNNENKIKVKLNWYSQKFPFYKLWEENLS